MKFRVLLLNQIFQSRDSSVIEKTPLKFCKRYLQVHNKASNIARKAELGKFHTIIDINKKILNYFSYLKGKDQDSAVKQALQFLIDLHISLVICVSRVGEHISLARDMCFAGGGTNITRDMCFPGRGTHITRDMCFPGRGTSITRDMCFLGRNKDQ